MTKKFTQSGFSFIGLIIIIAVIIWVIYWVMPKFSANAEIKVPPVFKADAETLIQSPSILSMLNTMHAEFGITKIEFKRTGPLDIVANLKWNTVSKIYSSCTVVATSNQNKLSTFADTDNRCIAGVTLTYQNNKWFSNFSYYNNYDFAPTTITLPKAYGIFKDQLTTGLKALSQTFSAENANLATWQKP